MAYDVGTKVTWKWGNGTATGKIAEKYTDDVEKTIKGNDVKREATKKSPAYLIEQDDGDKVFLHRGIAGRQFQRRFVLAEGIEVGSATIENGLLHIDLQRPKPGSRVRTIDIQGG